MMRSKVNFPISSLLLGTLLLFCLLSIVGVNRIVNRWTETVFAQLRQDALYHQSQILVNNIDSVTENCHLILQDYAAFPVIAHGVMQPEFALANIADFMDGLAILGHKCLLVLLDYRGKTIYATRATPKFDYTRDPWIHNIMTGKLRHYAGISTDKDHFFFRIAVPVRYAQHNEGVLVAELPVSQWKQQFRKTYPLDGAYLELRFQNQIFASFGSKISAPGQTRQLGHLNLDMYYQLDPSRLEYQRELLLLKLFTGLMISFIVVALLAYLVVRWGFIKSLIRLRDSIGSLATNRFHGNVETEQRITEIRQLAAAFNDMAHKIIDREKALTVAKAQLEEQVAARTAELRHELDEKLKTEDELKKIQEELEDRVKKRTRELESTNQELQNTLQKLANTQGMLLQNEKMASIGQLAAGIAHEINNPAGYVASNLKTLSEYVHDFKTAIVQYETAVQEWQSAGFIPEAQTRKLAGELEGLGLTTIRADIGDLLHDAHDGMKRISQIISNLKDFSHVNRNEVEEFDLNTVIEQTINVAWHELKYKAEVVRDFGDIPLISGFPGQLGQVIMNILVNAAQSIPQQGRITIKTWSETDRVYCSIADTGCGIPQNIVDKIFDPFFTTKPVGKGTGLGLNIAYNIITGHHGTITVNSALGEGTVFTIMLPIVFVEETESATSNEVPCSTR